MNTLQVCSSGIVVPSNTKRREPSRLAFWMVRICCAITDSTSSSMRLNSSKQDQEPDAARPLKNFAMAR